MPIRDIVVTVVVFGLLPACLLRPWVGILVWSWLGYMNPHRATWAFAYSMPFAELVAIATLTGLVLTRDRRSIPWSREMVLMLLLFAYFTLTTCFAWAPEEAWDQWTKLGKIMLFTVITPMLIYGHRRIHLLLLVVAFSIGFYGLKGGIFTILTGGVYMIYGPEGSFIADNNSIGLAMLMILPMLMLIAREESRIWIRRGLHATAMFNIIAIIFTYSRGAMLGLAVAFVPLFLRSRHKIWVLLLLIPVVIVGSILIPQELYTEAESISEYQQDTSALLRLQAWSVAWNVALERPLVGAGFNFAYIDDDRWLSYAAFLVDNAANYARAAHSIYFQVLGDHGFVGLGIFLAMLGFSWLRLRKIRKWSREHQEHLWLGNYAAAIEISLIGYGVAGAFLSLAYFDLVYLLIAITAILHREVQDIESEGAVEQLHREDGAGKLTFDSGMQGR